MVCSRPFSPGTTWFSYNVTFDALPPLAQKSEGKSGSIHHVNFVKVGDLKLNDDIHMLTTGPTGQKSYFGEC